MAIERTTTLLDTVLSQLVQWIADQACTRVFRFAFRQKLKQTLMKKIRWIAEKNNLQVVQKKAPTAPAAKKPKKRRRAD